MAQPGEVVADGPVLADAAQGGRHRVRVLVPALFPGGARGQVDGVAPIQIQVGGQRHQRRMRMGVGDMPQGRPARIAPLDHPGGLAGGPVGDVQAFRQVPGAVQIVVVVHAVQVLLARRALFGQVHVVVVHRAQLRAAFLGQQDVVEADAVALRVQVHLAHRVGLVAAVAKALGQRGQRGHGQRGSEIAVAVAARRGAGHHAAPRGDADWTLSVGARIAGAQAGQVVQRRRLDDGMAGAAQQGAGPLVDHDEEHVGRMGHGGVSRLRILASLGRRGLRKQGMTAIADILLSCLTPRASSPGASWLR